MNTNPEQDPWDRIVDHDRDPVTPEQMDEKLREQHSGSAPLLLILFGTFVAATGITAAVLYYIGKALDLP